MAGESCKTCDYHRATLAGDGRTIIKVCKAEPPVPLAIPVQTPNGMQIGIQAVFPMTDEGEWCGKHKPLLKLVS